MLAHILRCTCACASFRTHALVQLADCFLGERVHMEVLSEAESKRVQLYSGATKLKYLSAVHARSYVQYACRARLFIYLCTGCFWGFFDTVQHLVEQGTDLDQQNMQAHALGSTACGSQLMEHEQVMSFVLYRTSKRPRGSKFVTHRGALRILYFTSSPPPPPPPPTNHSLCHKL